MMARRYGFYKPKHTWRLGVSHFGFHNRTILREMKNRGGTFHVGTPVTQAYQLWPPNETLQSPLLSDIQANET